ncbi:hypothetical protein MK528_11395, partial [Streptococcus gordonii]|nr:hypothetical protein [Streptococcus gordonii]
SGQRFFQLLSKMYVNEKFLRSLRNNKHQKISFPLCYGTQWPNKYHQQKQFSPVCICKGK